MLAHKQPCALMCVCGGGWWWWGGWARALKGCAGRSVYIGIHNGLRSESKFLGTNRSLSTQNLLLHRQRQHHLPPRRLEGATRQVGKIPLSRPASQPWSGGSLLLLRPCASVLSAVVVGFSKNEFMKTYPECCVSALLSFM